MLRLHSRRQFLRQSAAFAASACATPVIAGNNGCFPADLEVKWNVVETLQSGAIGPIREAICWSRSASLADFQSHGRLLLGAATHALSMGRPTSTLAAGTTPPSQEFPSGMAVRYEFPESAGRRAQRITWYDGEWAPPYDSIDDVPLPEFGMLYLGSTGQLLDDLSEQRVFLLCDGQSPRVLPHAVNRSPWSWLAAWKKRAQAPIGPERTALADQMVLASLRAYEQQQPSQWDGAGMLA